MSGGETRCEVEVGEMRDIKGTGLCAAGGRAKQVTDHARCGNNIPAIVTHYDIVDIPRSIGEYGSGEICGKGGRYVLHGGTGSGGSRPSEKADGSEPHIEVTAQMLQIVYGSRIGEIQSVGEGDTSVGGFAEIKTGISIDIAIGNAGEIVFYPRCGKYRTKRGVFRNKIYRSYVCNNSGKRTGSFGSRVGSAKCKVLKIKSCKVGRIQFQ